MSVDREKVENDELVGEVVETEGENEERTADEKASPAARKLEPVVLAHVLGPNYQPVKPRVIAKQLKLPSEQHRALKLCIRRLVKAGKLVYGAGHIVRRPKAVPAARSQEPGARSQDSGDRGQGTGDRRQDSTAAERSLRDGKNVVIGTFRRTSKGFGFVRPQGAKRGDKAGDVYIPASSTM